MDKMETEARFIVPNKIIFRKLKSTGKIGGFILGDEHSTKVTDRYYDTYNRDLLKQNFYCRHRLYRDDNNRKINRVSVKNINKSKDAVLSRHEIEEQIEKFDVYPSSWKNKNAKKIIAPIVKEEKLVRVLTILQYRHKRLISSGKTMFEFSLDKVVSFDRKFIESYMVLELELMTPKSKLDDNSFARIIEILSKEWKLIPFTVSKFERALQIKTKRK